MLAPAIASAGWPFHAENGIKRGSPEWYAIRAMDPPGDRQVCKHGKIWPAVPRPVGPKPTFWHQYYATHYWPLPYVCEDRQQVRAALHQQAAAGWTSATTLHNYHFDQETLTLNSAGLKHLNWILGYAPPQHRQVFVATMVGDQTAEARRANVEQQIIQTLGDVGTVPVSTRLASPEGTAANRVEAIQRATQSNMLAPTISYSSTGSGGGGGGGAPPAGP